MASLNVKTEYSEYKDCKLRVGKYVEDNSVAGGGKISRPGRSSMPD